MCLSHWVWNDLEFSLQMKYLCLISSDTQVPISQVVGLLGRQLSPVLACWNWTFSLLFSGPLCEGNKGNTEWKLGEWVYAEIHL